MPLFTRRDIPLIAAVVALMVAIETDHPLVWGAIAIYCLHQLVTATYMVIRLLWQLRR